MHRQILFRCPRTGINVQHRIDDERSESSASADSYVPVRCPACMSLHFVNSATGRLLNERHAQPAARPRSA
ncbi:hypothetical protein ML401_06310 [Bradyrhizobium sp. 62B]|jgi:hypothetical protein|uniref:hypothetical protein n=1 Tax=unclassified Bradyrhizobium TaxID=2631580 RepID=UPI001888B492|nr:MULTISPECIES: hypothetical protein [unclassified Bradyrhizobium]MCS3764934.1 putative C2H2 Zn-finger protein [Bradyrhizobium centrosematis]MDT4743771.1 hypothetical protein [Bradyrhizobium sp. WYCCWR 12699]QOZ75260.1 hypothetical protein XH83_07305 [Bradyrhizobium sp. CCBAU 53351]WIW47724.1 hypothetical protein ML401_06310 [Bradyrhizobium sp. 62B]